MKRSDIRIEPGDHANAARTVLTQRLQVLMECVAKKHPSVTRYEANKEVLIWRQMKEVFELMDDHNLKIEDLKEMIAATRYRSISPRMSEQKRIF